MRIRQVTISHVDVSANANFKRWFGHSVVVDAHGKPQVVYHGTSGNFNVFNTPIIWVTPHSDYAEDYALHQVDITANIMPLYAAIEHPFDYGFRDSRTEVKFEDVKGRVVRNLNQGHVPKSMARAVYDDLCDLVDNSKYAGYKRVWEWQAMPEMISIVKRMGYDGLVAREGSQAQYGTYGAFEPTQIKSAIGNSGKFSQHDPDITR